jgi:excisionase family DNA binding protein
MRPGGSACSWSGLRADSRHVLGSSAPFYNGYMLLTVREVAERLKQSPEFVWKLCARNELPHFRHGRYSIRIDAAELEAWRQQHHHPISRSAAPSASADTADTVDSRHGQATSSGVVTSDPVPSDGVVPDDEAESDADIEGRPGVRRTAPFGHW